MLLWPLLFRHSESVSPADLNHSTFDYIRILADEVGEVKAASTTFDYSFNSLDLLWAVLATQLQQILLVISSHRHRLSIYSLFHTQGSVQNSVILFQDKAEVAEELYLYIFLAEFSPE